ncbi:MAG: tetratricopeptide repeat protein [Myxococcota bacterium]
MREREERAAREAEEGRPARVVPPEVQALISKGNRFYALGDYDAARVQYLEALKEDNGSPEAHYGLGMTYLAMGDMNGAIIAWRRAGGVDTVTANLFDEFRSFRAARDAVQAQLRSTRRNQAAVLARAEEPVGERYVSRGTGGLLDSSTKAMLGRLEIAGAAADGEGEAAPALGDESLAPRAGGIEEEDLAQARLPRSASELKLSVLDVPDTAPSPGGPAAPPLSADEAQDPKARGLYYVRTGNDPSAIAAFEEATASNPEDGESLEYLAGLYLAAAKTDKAEEAYKRLALLRPDASQPLTNLGGLYMNLGRFDEAVETLQQALGRDPRDSLAMNNLAGVYYKTGRVDEAVLQLKRALEVNPRDLNAHNNLAGIYYRQERFDRAIAQLQKILSIDPSHGVAAANLEEAFKRKREHENARRERKMRARQIVVASREEAQAVRSEIHNGDDFVRLARERSIDASSAKGGDIGFFSKGELESQVEESIIRLAPGEISGVVKTPAGYAIFQRLN